VAEDDDDDLRWRLSPRTLLFLIPGYLRFASRKRPSQDPLDLGRQVWLAFFSSLLAYGVVIIFVVPSSVEHSATPWIVALSVLAATCLVAEEVFGRRLLDGNDPERLSLAYRTRFFIQVALSELIALGAFVATFITGQWWVYWLFLPFALLGLWRAAPTKAHLLREDEQLRAAGCPVSLTGVLRNRQDRR
jgi:hypothetical protein